MFEKLASMSKMEKLEKLIDKAEQAFNVALSKTWDTLSGISAKKIAETDGLNAKLDEFHDTVFRLMDKVLSPEAK